MISSIKRVRKLHYRGCLISSSQLAEAHQPQVDAHQAYANETQRIAESFGISLKEALPSAVKRYKWKVGKMVKTSTLNALLAARKSQQLGDAE